LARLVRFREEIKDDTAVTAGATNDVGKKVIILNDVNIDDTALVVNVKNTTEIELDGFTADKLNIGISSDGGVGSAVAADFDGAVDPLTTQLAA